MISSLLLILISFFQTQPRQRWPILKGVRNVRFSVIVSPTHNPKKSVLKIVFTICTSILCRSNGFSLISVFFSFSINNIQHLQYYVKKKTNRMVCSITIFVIFNIAILFNALKRKIIILLLSEML